MYHIIRPNISGGKLLKSMELFNNNLRLMIKLAGIILLRCSILLEASQEKLGEKSTTDMWIIMRQVQP